MTLSAVCAPPLSAADYERIFHTVFSVTEPFVDPTTSCVLFSMVGALILKTRYGRPAQFCAGAAAYVVEEYDDGGTILLFGVDGPGGFRPVGNLFHCWVEVDGWVIDFMAPLFGEALRHREGGPARLPRKMFQRRYADIVNAVRAGQQPPFGLVRDAALTVELADAFLRSPERNLVEACMQWFAPTPQVMPPTFNLLETTQNKLMTLKLHGPRVEGSW